MTVESSNVIYYFSIFLGLYISGYLAGLFKSSTKKTLELLP